MKFSSQSLVVALATGFVITPDDVSAFSAPLSVHPSRSRAPLIVERSRTVLQVSSSTDSSKDIDEQTKALLEKTAKLRAEIAALEGKTIDQVEQEAKEKKEQEASRIAEAEQRRVEQEAEYKSSWKNNRADFGKVYVDVPVTIDDMLLQAKRAIEKAYQDGITRQTVRLALLREDETIASDVNLWPGGAQQMYREAAKPLTMELMRRLSTADEKDKSFLPPTVNDQDIWDFDGSGLITAEAQSGAKDDIQALVFPNTDTKYIKDIAEIDESMGKDRLFLLINPFWRNLESWGFNLLAPGAKNKAKETIFDQGYDETYVLLRFSARGESCIAIKAYPYDWQVFAVGEDEYGFERPVWLGESKEEPKTEFITKLLNDTDEFKLSKTMRQMQKRF